VKIRNTLESAFPLIWKKALNAAIISYNPEFSDCLLLNMVNLLDYEREKGKMVSLSIVYANRARIFRFVTNMSGYDTSVKFILLVCKLIEQFCAFELTDKTEMADVLLQIVRYLM